MENIYNDFITRFLPQVEKGLVITRDYFNDLFGRYVKYLLIVDSILLVLAVIVFVIGIIFTIKGLNAEKTGFKWSSGEQDWGAEKTTYFICGLIFIALGGVSMISGIMDVSKDIFVPEVRVYEQINSYRNNISPR